MASCSHLFSCPLFAVFTMNSALTVWKSNYCSADFARCARYRLSAEGKPVPQNLLPNGKSLALAQAPHGERA
jgi:hypothetical protein